MAQGNRFAKRAKVDRRVILRLLAMLPPGKTAAYTKIADGNREFLTAYREADKDLPICEECGHNCRVLTADVTFGPEFWSHCCHAPIEQDGGT